MNQIRQHEHKCLSTGHVVAAVFVCARPLAAVILTDAVIMAVAKAKEAAP